MKKTVLILFALLLFLPTGCGRSYDYSAHLSELRRDIFRAETETYSLTLSCIEREHPYAQDGIACPLTSVAEISFAPADKSVSEVDVVFSSTGEGGDMTFRSVEDDWFYSQSMPEFPQKTVSLKITMDGKTEEIVATSVKNEDTVSVEEALKIAVGYEKDTISRMTKDGLFQGEFRVRLLRRQENYYYVGIIGKGGNCVHLLIGAESGEVLARRQEFT